MNNTSTQQRYGPPALKWAEHLCYVISQGFDLSDRQVYRTMTKNPRFKCGHCGRRAHSQRNVCVPLLLRD